MIQVEVTYTSTIIKVVRPHGTQAIVLSRDEWLDLSAEVERWWKNNAKEPPTPRGVGG